MDEKVTAVQEAAPTLHSWLRGLRARLLHIGKCGLTREGPGLLEYGCALDQTLTPLLTLPGTLRLAAVETRAYNIAPDPLILIT